MTAEGEALEVGDAASAARWAKEKGQGQEKLQEISGDTAYGHLALNHLLSEYLYIILYIILYNTIYIILYV